VLFAACAVYVRARFRAAKAHGEGVA